MKYKQPLRYYTTVYERELSTIKRYSRANAPLDDPEAMKLFLANKKDTGRAGKSRKGMGKTASKASSFATASPGALAGAEHALRRLAEEERQANARLDAAKASGDPDALKLATDLYIKIAESLLRYDRQVTADRRDSGEVITRVQVEGSITALTVWLRRGVEAFINGASLQIAELEKPEDMYLVVADPLRKCLGNAVSAACGDGKFPPWMKQAFEAGL